MWEMRNESYFTQIKIRFAWCALCIFIICISRSGSVVAGESNALRNFYDPKIFDEDLYDGAVEFIDEGATPDVSALNKINLMRFNLGTNFTTQPFAVVVDTARTFYETIKRLWTSIMTGSNASANLMLFTYNDTDCSLIKKQKDDSQDAVELLKLIPASTAASEGAETILECVNQALNMVQPDSSIMVLTGRKPGDGNTLRERIADNMIRKRCKFNGVWCSKEQNNRMEINDYEEIAQKTNGNFFLFTDLDREKILTAAHPKDKSEDYTKKISLDDRGSFPTSDMSTGFTVISNLSTTVNDDESADLLYDPRVFDYQKQRAFGKSFKMLNVEKENEQKETLESEDMVRASLTAIESTIRLETTSVEVTRETNLVGTPGSISRLTFHVTNNYPLTIRHYFQAKSTSFDIVYLQPRNVWLEYGQTVTVVADVLVPTTATDSTTETFTLLIQGIESVEKLAYLYVRQTGSTISDTVKPTISYSFNNNCAGKLSSGTCANNLWSVDVTVQDSDSGLQRVTSSPKGIKATASFIGGTKSTVKFQYAATCCQTSVAITAEDLLGNSNSNTIDVTIWYNLSECQIWIIVLAVLLILIIIAAVIIAIVCFIRRRKKSQDLPYTQRYGTRPPRAERTSF